MALRLIRPAWFVAAVAVAVLAVGAVVVAVEVTPMQEVRVAGQVIDVGAAPALSVSGPGEVDLFGQRLPTVISFPGPVRPRLQLSQITLDSELANFVQGSAPGQAAGLVGSRLVAGWERYLGWEAAIAGLAALAAAGALAGWRRLPARATVRLLALTLAAAELVNAGAAGLAAGSTRQALGQVRSLSQLVASTPAAPARHQPQKPLLPGVQEVVIGDSTAAGAGLPAVADASPVDRACGRSSAAYAADLAAANGWRAVNLACDSATVAHGLLGPQQRGGQQVPAQLAAAARVADPSVVIVSVGADDLQWSAIVEYCVVARQCGNRASAAFFQQKLAAFSTGYLRLLVQLGELPGHPQVIINRYYDPFGGDIGCITRRGLTTAKVATLRTWLNALNKVLSSGAAQFGDASPQPSFAGHQLCSARPYIQGLADPAPFHPTALGQMAIALADQAVIRDGGGQPAVPSPSAAP